MQELLTIIICFSFSLNFKTLLYQYWQKKEVYKDQHNSDSWVIGVILGSSLGVIMMDYFVVF